MKQMHKASIYKSSRGVSRMFVKPFHQKLVMSDEPSDTVREFDEQGGLTGRTRGATLFAF